MKIIIEKDYEQLSKTAMHILLGLMYEPKHMHLSITAGSTPKRMYELLTAEIRQKRPFENVTFYNFDEIPVAGSEYGVTMTNLNNMFFEPAGIDRKYVHVLDETNYKTHDAYLKSMGGLDAILLGLGEDGHFCGNIPHVTAFSDETVSVQIDSHPGMRNIIKNEVGGDESKIPEFYVTMGPKAVMNVRKVIMFASGKKKAEIVKEAFWGKVTEDRPSSVFQLHPDFTLILDEEAAQLITN